MSMYAEIRKVTEADELGEIIPDWSSLEYLDPDNEPGQVTLGYPTNGKRADLIEPNQEYALLIDGKEAPNGRFRLDETDGNTITEGSSEIKWSGSTLMARFDEILVAPRRDPRAKEDMLTPEERKYKEKQDAYESAMKRYNKRLRDWRRNGEKGDKPKEPKEPKRDNRLEKGLDNAPPPNAPTFKQDTPGQVIRYIFQLGQSRGAGLELKLGFTSDRDSAGKKWATKVTQRWDAGTTLLEVITWMAENSKAEFRMRGRKLMAYNPGTGVDHNEPPVLLARGKNIVDGPRQGTAKDLATSVLCISDTGVHGWVRDGELVKEHGRVEATLRVSGVKTWDALEALGKAYLKNHGQIRYSFTYGIIPGKGADPYKDYWPGDWVYVLDGDKPVKRRVRQIGIAFDSNRDARIAVTVNDIITEREIRQIKLLRSLTGRSAVSTVSSGTGGANGRTAAQEADGRAPKRPSTPTFASRAGTLAIQYDGADEDGEEPVYDQAYVEVHIGDNEEFEIPEDLSTLVDTIRDGAGAVTMNNVDYDSQFYYRLVAVDEGGDRSEPTDAIPAIVSKIVVDDIESLPPDPEAIHTYETQYAVGPNETDIPLTGWSTETPIREPGEYIWYRTTVTYGNGTYSTTSPVLLTGNDGAPGPGGLPGPPGADGSPTYIWLKYADTPTTGMNDLPDGKAYMGIAYNKTTPVESSNYGDYAWSLILGPEGPPGDQGIPGVPGADGAPTYTWVKYGTSSAGAGLSDDPTGKAYIGLAFNKSTPTESTTPGDYTWSLIQGPAGSQGIQGPPGADGTPRYMWLKYADTPTTGMSDSPTGKVYMGVAYNKTTATESSTYSDYEWSLIQGPQGNQGIQGPPGADGTTTYTWVKYATNATGTTGFSDSPAGATYIGLAFNKTTATESSDPAQYQWSLIQGPQGNTGIQGPPGADGTPRYMWLKYADTPTTGISDSPTGKTYMGVAYNKTTATESSAYADYEWSLIVGPQGPPGNTGIQGPPGADGQPTYTWVKYGTSAAGAGLSDDPTGKTYIGLAFNKTTPTESTVATDYTWSLIQGPQGSQGVPGTPGADGTPRYMWLKYADTPTTGMSDSPTGKAYMGVAYNKTTATESSTYSDYEWNLVQGPQGDQGIPGTPGADGTTTYTWVKYATNATGTAGFSDSPTGATYIGLAFNKTTATESSTPTDYQWSLIQGPQGAAGSNGVSVTAITPYFARVAQAAAVPTQPTNQATPPAPWQLTEPAYADNTFLYRTEKVSYSNGTYSYTTVVKVAQDAAAGPSAAPTSSPALKATGNASSIVLTAENVERGTSIKYYGSTTSGFTPGPSNFIAESQATVFVVNSLTQNASSNPLLPETAYYFKAIAHNIKGDAPASSAEVSDTLHLDVVTSNVMSELVAGFILAGKIQVGQAYISADEGIVIPQPDGGTISFPVNGSFAQITAKLIARSLSVTDYFTLTGSNNQVFGQLTFGEGIVKPQVGPSLSGVTRIYESGNGPDLPNVFHGWMDDPADGTAWIQPFAFFGTGVRRIRKSDYGWLGDMTISGIPAAISDFQPSGGMIYASSTSRYVMLGTATDSDLGIRWYLVTFSRSGTTLTYQGRLDVAAYSAFPNQVRVAFDSATGDGWIVYMSDNADNKLRMIRFTPSSTPTRDTSIVPYATAMPTKYDIGGFYIGNADFGAKRWIVMTKAGTNFVFSGTGVASGFTRQTNDEFSRVGTVMGLTWDGTRFWSYASNGNVNKYSTLKAPAGRNTVPIQARHTWYDNTGTAHETDGGPIEPISLAARMWLRIETDPAPDTDGNPLDLEKADAIRMYVSSDGATTPRLQVPDGWASMSASTSALRRKTRTQVVAATLGDGFVSYSQTDTFVQDDVGGTITGTGIPAGAIITSVNPNGTRAYFSGGTISASGTPTVTITPSVYTRVGLFESINNSAAAPPAVNGFALVDRAPGAFKSTRTDANGPLAIVRGDGSGRFGPWQFDNTGKTMENFGPERPGTVIFWPGSGVPLDCVQAAGQEVPRPVSAGGANNIYANLWAIFGTAWGPGNGSTTFNLPNWTNRVPRAVSGSPVGIFGGSDTVTMPDHNHYAGTLSANAPANANTWLVGNSGANQTPRVSEFNNHTHNVTGQTGVVVSNPAISNVPAYFGVKVLLKL